MQNHELEALPDSERNLEASMQDVQTKLELIKQLQPLWLRFCLLSPPLLSATIITVVAVSCWRAVCHLDDSCHTLLL